MRFLYYAHSGVRYLVLLAAVFAIAALVVAAVRKTAPGKLQRVAGAAFAGLLDLQVLLGLALILTGIYYPQLLGHVALMVLAAASAHAGLILGRKRPVRSVALPLGGIALSLLLIAGGVMAIGRGLFSSSVMGG